MQHMSKAEIEKNISKKIAEVTASMNALKAVKINTKHKKLTNRAKAIYFNHIMEKDKIR